jgi:FkbM family methyltransferase
MTLPPLWKIGREIGRAVAKVKVTVWRPSGLKTSIAYRGLSVLMNRAGMNDKVLMAISRGIYEELEILGLRHAIKPSDRVLEVGSGLGIITALAAQTATAAGRVLSFAANPEIIPDTAIFLAAHGIANVALHHAVLVPHAAPGETRAFYLATSVASSSLLGAGEAIAVPTRGISDGMAEFKPDVLICDIEGGEAELIPALDASGLRAAVIELHPDRLADDQIAAVYAALAGHGLCPSANALGGTVVMFERQGA